MELTMTTKPRTSSCTFTWKIEKFHLMCPKGCKEFDQMKSQSFTVGEDTENKSEWFVKLRGMSEHIACYLSMDLHADRINKFEGVYCYSILSVGNDENQRIFERILHHKFTADKIDWGYKEFFSIAELYERKETLLRNNTLQICVQMEIFTKHNTTVELHYEKNVNHLEILSADFQDLFNNKKHSDIEIACGTQTFFAHKIILSARSKVFSAMFDSEMQESTTSRVVLADIDAVTFHAILLYIYTGKFEKDNSTSYTELIYGAEKYDLSELKQHCFRQLCESVTDETIGTIAVAAEKYNADERTKEFIKKYCQRNITTLWESQEFKNLVASHPKAFL